MKSICLFLEVASDRSLLRRGLVVSLIVGCLLNLINQGDLLLSGDFAQVSWTKFLLTYCVPFCVSVYSATSAKMRFDPGTKAYVATRLLCEACHHTEITVEAGELVPQCPECLQKTSWKRMPDALK